MRHEYFVWAVLGKHLTSRLAHQRGVSPFEPSERTVYVIEDECHKSFVQNE
jgi:hypothetical protein